MILPFSKKTFVVIVMKMVVWKSPWDKSGGNLPLTAGYNRHSEYRWSQKPKTFTPKTAGPGDKPINRA